MGCQVVFDAVNQRFGCGVAIGDSTYDPNRVLGYPIALAVKRDILHFAYLSVQAYRVGQRMFLAPMEKRQFRVNGKAIFPLRPYGIEKTRLGVAVDETGLGIAVEIDTFYGFHRFMRPPTYDGKGFADPYSRVPFQGIAILRIFHKGGEELSAHLLCILPGRQVSAQLLEIGCVEDFFHR